MGIDAARLESLNELRAVPTGLIGKYGDLHSV